MFYFKVADWRVKQEGQERKGKEKNNKKKSIQAHCLNTNNEKKKKIKIDGTETTKRTNKEQRKLRYIQNVLNIQNKVVYSRYISGRKEQGKKNQTKPK